MATPCLRHATALSYRKIQVVSPLADDALEISAMAQLVNRHIVEPRQQLTMQLQPEGPNDLMPERRACFSQQRIVNVVVADGANDFAYADPASLARQPVAAARPAHADKDAAAHQVLQRLFEIAARNALPAGDLATLYGRSTGMIGDIQHRLDGEQRLARQAQHQPLSPPKPAGRPCRSSRSRRRRVPSPAVRPPRASRRA